MYITWKISWPISPRPQKESSHNIVSLPAWTCSNKKASVCWSKGLDWKDNYEHNGGRHWTKFQALKWSIPASVAQSVCLHSFKSYATNSCNKFYYFEPFVLFHLFNPTIPISTSVWNSPLCTAEVFKGDASQRYCWNSPWRLRGSFFGGTYINHPEMVENTGEFCWKFAGKYHHPKHTTMDFISMFFFHILGHFEEGWLKSS